ncbi:hypothetical protein [Cellulomonas timonensis]|uniref:hypothetical protein n=1 Tax=Cellulomonas timonensis TaxID=1689271 RepID=UPI00082CB1A6|nr:hypothetical protein [Cellulomonas timonensis]
MSTVTLTVPARRTRPADALRRALESAPPRWEAGTRGRLAGYVVVSAAAWTAVGLLGAAGVNLLLESLVVLVG